eukprot:PITA_26704
MRIILCHSTKIIKLKHLPFSIPTHRKCTQLRHEELRFDDGSCLKVRDVTLLCKRVLSSGSTAAGNSDTLFCLLQACANKKALTEDLVDARHVFDKMSERNMYSWNVMIRGYSLHGFCEDALTLFCELQKSDMQPDIFTFPSVLKACAGMSDLEQGKSVHDYMLRNGFQSDGLLGNALVDMYAKCGSVEDARHVFDKMSQRDIVTWNAMIVGYVRNGRYEQALETFSMMESRGARPDSITISGVLPACGHLIALKWGKEIHCYLIRNGIESNLFVGNALLDMYAKCQSIEDAQLVFDKLVVRDVVSWNAMISGLAQKGYCNEAWKLFGQMKLSVVKPSLTTWNLIIARFSQNGKHEESFNFLHQMQLAGMKPDVATLTSILSACAHRGSLQHGKSIHAYIYRRGFEIDVIVESALLDMYAKCGHIHSASWVFDTMSQKDLVSWNSMIAGYAQNGHGNEAIQLLVQMQQADLEPDLSTIVNVIPACAHFAAMQKGKEIHNYTIRNGFDLNILIENALIDMYAKCGSLENARRIFDSMPNKDVVSWNTMIAGYGMHGNGETSLTLFHDMQQASIKPNHITFIAVLSACSHAGLVDEGLQYFESMNQDNTIAPTIEHYACMVDLLGRAGHLDEAYEFVKLIPFKPTPGIWGTLLSSCKVHSNFQLAERVADELFELEAENAGYYVLLSNIYAEAGRWENVACVRARMKEYGVIKKPGCSWIEIGNKIYSFLTGDGSYGQSEEIVGMSDRVAIEIKEAEYVPDTDFVPHDM